MSIEKGLHTLSREAAAMTLSRVESYDELHAPTEAESDQKYAEATSRHIGRISLQQPAEWPDTPEGKRAIRPVSKIDEECARYLMSHAGLADTARLDFPKAGKFPAGSLNVLTAGTSENFLYDADSDTAFYRPDEATTSASHTVYKTLTTLGLLAETPELETLVTYIDEFRPAEGVAVSTSIESLMKHINNPDEPVVGADLLADEPVAETASPEEVAPEPEQPAPVPVAAEAAPAPDKKRERRARPEQMESLNQALDVLFRTAQPFSDLFERAEAAQIDILVERDLGNVRKATGMAWDMVREINQVAAPRYLGQAKEKVRAIENVPFFADLLATVSPMLEEATRIYGKRHEIERMRVELEKATAAPEADIVELDKAREELERMEKSFERRGLPDVIGISQKVRRTCMRAMNDPRTRERMRQDMISRQRQRRNEQAAQPVPAGPRRRR